MKLYTTLRRIEAYNPCPEGMVDLIAHIGSDYPETEKIYFADVLKDGVDISNVLWGLKTVPDRYEPYAGKILCKFACACAEHVLPIFEKEYPDDKRARSAIEAARKVMRGEDSAYAARAAYIAAAYTAAHAARAAYTTAACTAAAYAARTSYIAAAYIAAAYATRAAYIAAACTAAVDAAYHAANTASDVRSTYSERAWQQSCLLGYLGG